MTAVRVLHVGVGRPHGAYGATLVDLAAYVASADDHLIVLADQLGVQRERRFGHDANRDDVAAAIVDVAEAMRAVDAGLFVLAFTGHGGQIDDRDDDETIDHLDECWGLDDRPLVDDELARLLSAFSPRVHVVLISNCCFAAGIDDDPRIELLARIARGELKPRGDDLAAEVRADLTRARREAWIDAVRELELSERYAPLATEVPAGARPRGHARGAHNRICAAVCQSGDLFMPPPTSAFTQGIVDSVFPPGDDGVRRRAGITYVDLDQRLKALAVASRPSVDGPPAVMQRPAFTGG